MNVTIYDIARLTGVSASTVSRVINHKPGVKDSTKRVIERCLEQNNYSPDIIARGLATRASGLIGILVADIRNIHHTDGAYFIEQELAKHGYNCLILNTGFDTRNMAESIRQMNQRRIEGMVLIGSAFQNRDVSAAIEQHFQDIPVIMMNGALELPNVYSVLADEQNGAFNCVQFLSGKGHKNIAFILHATTAANLAKLAGFKQAMAILHGKETPLVVETQTDIGAAYDATRRLMEEHPETDGILYGVDLIAASGIRALTDMKLAIPDRVAVIGINNSVYGELCNPKLTVLDNKLKDISLISARNLIDALDGRSPVHKLLVPSSVIERETT